MQKQPEKGPSKQKHRDISSELDVEHFKMIVYHYNDFGNRK